MPRLSPVQQGIVVLGVWLGAVLAAGADLAAAARPLALASVLVFALLLHLTTSR